VGAFKIPFVSPVSTICPDFIKLCDAFDIKAKVVSDATQLDQAIIEMRDCPQAYMLIVNTKRDENVYPMIAPGSAHNEMLFNES
jgi:acetolactate synthase-1/2/3 large subunit